jgi:hypothetical protein
MQLPGTDLERPAIQHERFPLHLELRGGEEGGEREEKREKVF